jgi:hypothetical protein
MGGDEKKRGFLEVQQCVGPSSMTRCTAAMTLSLRTLPFVMLLLQFNNQRILLSGPDA